MTALGSRSAAATAHGQIDGRSHPAYAEYRLSGVDWFQDVPAHWSVAPLYSRYEVQLGKMLDTSRITGRYLAPYLRNVDVQWDCVNINDLPAMDFPPSVRERYRLARGDLLVCEGGEVGRTAIWQDELEECYYQKAVHRLRRRRPDEHPRFLFYVMQAAASQGAFRAGSSLNTIDHLTAEKLRRHRLPFAPSDEQRAVSEFLDRETENIDALVAKKQRLIELLQEKRTALISHAVTKGLDPDVPMKDSGIEWLGEVPAAWHVTPLKRHLLSIEQGWSPQCEDRQKEADEWGVLKAGCANGGEYRATEHKALPNSLEPDSSLEVHVGDVLMSRANTRDLVGAAAFVTETPPRLMLCDKLYRLRPRTDSLDAKYLVYYLGSRLARYQLERDASGASDSMQNTSQASVRTLVFPAPPLQEQRRIVGTVDAATTRLRELTALAKTAVAHLLEYRSALITAAVTGQIDVRTCRREAS